MKKPTSLNLRRCLSETWCDRTRLMRVNLLRAAARAGASMAQAARMSHLGETDPRWVTWLWDFPSMKFVLTCLCVLLYLPECIYMDASHVLICEI